VLYSYTNERIGHEDNIFSYKNEQGRSQDFLLLLEMTLSSIVLLAEISIYLPQREEIPSGGSPKLAGGGEGWYSIERKKAVFSVHLVFHSTYAHGKLLISDFILNLTDQCYGSGPTRISNDLALMDPDPYRKCRSGSRTTKLTIIN
jgi:hypothetical protein